MKCVKILYMWLMYKVVMIFILELSVGDMDIESAAGVVAAVYSSACWCAVSFAADGTVSDLRM